MSSSSASTIQVNPTAFGGEMGPVGLGEQITDPSVVGKMKRIMFGDSMVAVPSHLNTNQTSTVWYDVSDDSTTHLVEVIEAYREGLTELQWLTTIVSDFQLLQNSTLEQISMKITHFPKFMAVPTSEYELGPVVYHNEEEVHARAQKFSMGVKYDMRTFWFQRNLQYTMQGFAQAVAAIFHRLHNQILSALHTAGTIVPSTAADALMGIGTEEDRAAAHGVRECFGLLNRSQFPRLDLERLVKDYKTSVTHSIDFAVLPYNTQWMMRNKETNFFKDGPELTSKKLQEFDTSPVEGVALLEEPFVRFDMYANRNLSRGFTFSETVCTIGGFIPVTDENKGKDIWAYDFGAKCQSKLEPKAEHGIWVRFNKHVTGALVMGQRKCVYSRIINPTQTNNKSMTRMGGTDFDAYIMAALKPRQCIRIPQFLYKYTIEANVFAVKESALDKIEKSSSWVFIPAYRITKTGTTTGGVDVFRGKDMLCIGSSGVYSDHSVTFSNADFSGGGVGGTASSTAVEKINKFFEEEKTNFEKTITNENSRTISPLSPYLFRESYGFEEGGKVKKYNDCGPFYGEYLDENFMSKMTKRIPAAKVVPVALV